MNQAELLERVRFLFGDTETSSRILREALIARPGNIIDGNNKIFYLLNRRIAAIDCIYDADGVEHAPTDYVLGAEKGRLVFNTPPTRPLFVDYTWFKLTDNEILTAASVAAASGGFVVSDNIPNAIIDYVIHYIVGYCFSSAASRAAEYYTLSAAGKHVAKSELYNHYVALSKEFLDKAQELRTDHITRRGTREEPADAEGRMDYAKPYFPSDGGI